jgi:hypothetical protein
MGMMGSIFGQPPGNGPQPQIISSFGNFVNLGGMLGNLGMRGPGPNQGGSIQMNIPLSPQSQPINLQPQPQTQPPTNPQPSPSQTHPQPSTQPQRISYA